MKLVVAVLCALFAWTAAAQELPEEALFRRKVVTSDGVSLALYRYLPSGGGSQLAPILLVPDVAFAREAYDFQGRGLARYLQAHGRDVFVVELRGQGRSSAPANWSLLDWVDKDLPAAMAAVRAAHPGKVDLLIQGFGGALALAATTKELKGQVNRVIAINVPIAAEVPNETVRTLLKNGGQFSQLATGKDGKRDFELLFTRGAQFSAKTEAEFRGQGLDDLSPRAAAELLSWMEKGDLKLRDGSLFSARIPALDLRMLMLLPIADNFSHPEFGSHLRDVAKAVKVTPKELSRFDLLAEDYTHLSVLLGSGAEDDVWSTISAYLVQTENPTGLTAEDTK